MSKLEQAARQVLKALENRINGMCPSAFEQKSITAMREALDHSGESNEMAKDQFRDATKMVADQAEQRPIEYLMEVTCTKCGATESGVLKFKEPIGIKEQDQGQSTFEAWWTETGQETLYALNTLTDADAKILAEFAWNAAPQPVNQELMLCVECGQPTMHIGNKCYSCCQKCTPTAWAAITKNGKLHKAASSKESAERKRQQYKEKFGDSWPLEVVPLYAAPQPMQEPVAIVDEIGLCLDGRPIFNAVGKVKVGQKLYAAPVQQVDLSDEDVARIKGLYGQASFETISRAVIAAYKEKNK